MPVSRRTFLETAACAVPGVALGHGGIGRVSHQATPRIPCVLIDLGQDCALRESLSGFARGLTASDLPFESASLQSINDGGIPPAGLVLVPGAVLRSPLVAASLYDAARHGAMVVYESGAAYAEPEAFAIEQRMLAAYFGVRAGAPIELWQPDGSATLWPYIHYTSVPVMIRDFSRAIPVTPAKALARIGDVAVADQLKLGDGEFIFLGSPVGPHMLTGDPQAWALLSSFSVRSGYRALMAARDRAGLR
jgi:hypothetical protein